ncbi:related to transcription co-repressor GAL80 [Lecanosticta acicola]|uniref:Related to transcription co-repressor GAL80 n=1 Tax=Lecanosticta acicola TaxID=111012 RepID=A0AAI8W2G0_9PEZI|nr:related to transcription co-repressor GAL80 [Lecanosticta acicola]
MAPIRLALIGLSQSAKTSWASEGHLPYLLSERGRERYQIKALLNSSVEAAHRAIECYNLSPEVKAYGSPHELAADPDIDLVVCTTRVDVHYDTIKPSIEAGKAAFVEWPLAENAIRAKELADLARKSGSQTIVGLQARVAPAILKLKDIIQSGKFGKVLSSNVHAHASYLNRDSMSEGLSYFLDKKVGGNPITIAFGHMIDYVHSVLGEFQASNHHTQIQRPQQRIYNKDTGAARPFTSDVPDLLSLHGTLKSSPYTIDGASLLVHYRSGPSFPGTKPLLWTINCEKGELRISSDRTPSLQAEGSAHPIPIEKRKTEASSNDRDGAPDTTKPSAVFKPTGGRDFTLSIALPGSIIANALTHDQKTSLAGQIARACAVFCVDEVVIFDDGQAQTREPERDGYTAFADPNFFLYHVLTYLETPPNLRKALFPMHPDLRTAGALPSLDMPHHIRSDEWCPFREGITTGPGKTGSSAIVDCGLRQKVVIPVEIEANTRVTLSLPTDLPNSHASTIHGEAVSPETPREQAGYYWGYNVRQASSLGTVFTECPFDGGYDVSIGTSERGKPVNAITNSQDPSYVELNWKHFLVVFGGVSGLEAALAADEELQAAGVSKAEELFDRWINLVPGQGSRTIRTEEAVWVGLTGLRPLIESRSAN